MTVSQSEPNGACEKPEETYVLPGVTLYDAIMRPRVSMEYDLHKLLADIVPGYPRCGFTYVVKEGTDGGVIPTFQCGRDKTIYDLIPFSSLVTPEIPEEMWLDFAQGLSDGMSLRELSGTLGISLKTSWTMRARLLEAVARDLADYERRPYLTGELDV